MEKKPKYSIVVATYNRSKALAEILTSASNQTIPRGSYEIIIIDDGSKSSQPGLIIKIFDFIRKPSLFASIHLLEYAIKCQIATWEEIDIKSFFEKSYTLHPEQKEN